MSEHCQEVQVNYNEEVGKSLNDGSNFDGEGQSAEGYKKISDLTPADIKRLEFDSEDDVYAFYSCYAQINGFCVRRDDVRRESNNNIIMRNLVCNRAGLRSKKHMERNDRVREPKPITRTNCMARLRAEFDNHTRKWMIVDFEDTHNHEMTPSQYVHLMPAYRSISDGIKAQVDSLRLHGVRTCHIMGLIIGQKGGHADVGFCKKDLYNYIDQQKRAKINDGDAFAALSYLQAKADSDSFMFSKFTTTEEGRLDNLFWSDGVSRLDYHCFGDVVAFDTTYKKNKYNKPLVVFSGYNHHGETVIFACALVSDEKTETYKWVLETFCECMFGKHPKAVVTDGDGAMREAIRAVLPSSFHRLCAWHLHKNACDNVKNSRFLEDLNPLIYGNFSPDDFESRWKKTIDEHGVANNNWVKKVYDMKTMWASAYMRDKFFAGIRTTSICEGINSFIKRYVQNKNSLVDFMHNFERAVKEYRHNELISDFKSLYTDPLLTTPLHVYESWASQVFTRNKFCEGNAHMLGSKRHKNKKKRKNTEDPARCANTNDAVDGGNNSHINFPVTNANFVSTLKEVERNAKDGIKNGKGG
ncbi:unnamed protein product [Cuscuta epithymum]|uniref:Protein FAR1-RELATED SEQUENCE n=1 Tax=Cuscuta epithymum TaxID=186058 RepID=A0AAV0FTX1_9ASTE|nr:unnamed protein product [Cuscuta epithymum]